MRRPLPIYIYMYVVGEHVLLQVWRTPIVSYRTKRGTVLQIYAWPQEESIDP